jgi:hypothetical protein
VASDAMIEPPGLEDRTMYLYQHANVIGEFATQ